MCSAAIAGRGNGCSWDPLLPGQRLETLSLKDKDVAKGLPVSQRTSLSPNCRDRDFLGEEGAGWSHSAEVSQCTAVTRGVLRLRVAPALSSLAVGARGVALGHPGVTLSSGCCHSWGTHRDLADA